MIRIEFNVDWKYFAVMRSFRESRRASSKVIPLSIIGVVLVSVLYSVFCQYQALLTHNLVWNDRAHLINRVSIAVFFCLLLTAFVWPRILFLSMRSKLGEEKKAMVTLTESHIELSGGTGEAHSWPWSEVVSVAQNKMGFMIKFPAERILFIPTRDVDDKKIEQISEMIAMNSPENKA